MLSTSPREKVKYQGALTSVLQIAAHEGTVSRRTVNKKLAKLY